MSKPISIETALETILSSVLPLDPVVVSLDNSLGLVLAEPVTARDDVPYVDNSAMDGFALRAEDTSRSQGQKVVRLRILETMLAAGRRVETGVAPLTACRIMTGAAIPSGANTVLPVENAVEENGHLLVKEPLIEGAHIRRAGEDMRTGETVLPRGTPMNAGALAVAATAGRSEVTVRPRPRVAIITTGDELVPISAAMEPGLVRNSNAHALAALIRESGGEPVILNHAADNELEIADRIDLARRADVVLTSGGVSMGERDLVREVLEAQGMRVKFWKVHVKPGKPFLFGMLDGKPVFGIPGNPVTTHVAFEIFVRPALRKMLGYARIFRPVQGVRLAADIKRTPGRDEFLRVRLRRNGDLFLADLTRSHQGSGITTSLPFADGLLFIDGETVVVPKGETCPCVLLEGRDEEGFPIRRI